MRLQALARGLANDERAVVQEADTRRRERMAERIGHDAGRAVAPHGDETVGGAEVDTDDHDGQMKKRKQRKAAARGPESSGMRGDRACRAAYRKRAAAGMPRSGGVAELPRAMGSAARWAWLSLGDPDCARARPPVPCSACLPCPASPPRRSAHPRCAAASPSRPTCRCGKSCCALPGPDCWCRSATWTRATGRPTSRPAPATAIRCCSWCCCPAWRRWCCSACRRGWASSRARTSRGCRASATGPARCACSGCWRSCPSWPATWPRCWAARWPSTCCWACRSWAAWR